MRNSLRPVFCSMSRSPNWKSLNLSAHKSRTERAVRTDSSTSHLTAAGVRVVNWQPDGNPLCIAAAAQLGVAMTEDSAGGVICAWSDDRHPALLHSIYAQRVLANDTTAWNSNGVRLAERSFPQDSPRERGNRSAIILAALFGELAAQHQPQAIPEGLRNRRGGQLQFLTEARPVVRSPFPDCRQSAGNRAGEIIG